MKKILIPLLVLISMGLYALDFEAISFVDYYGQIEPSEGYDNLRSRIFFQPKLVGYEDNSGLEWYLSANLYYQPIGDPQFVDPWDMINEAYLFLPLGNWDVSLGHKMVTRGHSDIFSTLSKINSSEKTVLSMDDGFTKQRSDLMLHVQLYPSFEDTIELIYVPIPRADKEQEGPVTLREDNLNVDVHFEDEPYLLDHPHSLFFYYSRYMDNLDIQLFYGWYTRQSPGFDVSELNDSGSVLSGKIYSEYHRTHSVAFAYSTYLWDLALSQEFGININDNWDGKDLGMPHSDVSINTQIQGVLPGGFLSQLMMIYKHMINFDEHDSSFTPSLENALVEELDNYQLQPKKHILFFIAHTENSYLRERLKVALNVGFFFNPNVLLTPRVSYQFTDRFQSSIGADFIIGDPSEMELRGNPVNDNYYIRLMYQY